MNKKLNKYLKKDKESKTVKRGQENKQETEQRLEKDKQSKTIITCTRK